MIRLRDEREHSADPIDQANDTAEDLLQAGIADTRDKLAPESHPDFDGEHCAGCGEEMPAARLAMRRVRCMPCQDLVERGGRR